MTRIDEAHEVAISTTSSRVGTVALGAVVVGIAALAALTNPLWWYGVLGAAVFLILSVLEVVRPSRVVLDEQGLSYETPLPFLRWHLDWNDLRDASVQYRSLQLTRAEGLPLRIGLWGMGSNARSWLVSSVQDRLLSTDALTRMPGQRSADGIEVKTGISEWSRYAMTVWNVVFALFILGALGPLLWMGPTGPVAIIALVALGLVWVGWTAFHTRKIWKRPDAIRIGTRDLALFQKTRVIRRIPLSEIESATHQRLRSRLLVRLKSGERVSILMAQEAMVATDAARVAQGIEEAARAATDEPRTVDPRLAELTQRVRESDS